jgi:hypothetical protein
MVYNHQHISIAMFGFMKRVSCVKSHLVKLILDGNTFEFSKFWHDIIYIFNKLTLLVETHHIFYFLDSIMLKTTFVDFCKCPPFSKMANLTMQIKNNLSMFIGPWNNETLKH